MNSFRVLSEEVESAIKGRPGFDKNAFLCSLKRHKLNFLNLLKNLPPSAEARQQIEQEKRVTIEHGFVQQLNKHDIDLAKQLSDEFKLNEVTCVQLLIAAHKERGSAEAQIAAGIYLEERKSLVASLHRLLQTQALDFEDDQGLVDMICQFNNELLVDRVNGVSLVGRIIHLIKNEGSDAVDRGGVLAFVQDHRGRVVERSVLLARECVWLCECLFYAVTCLEGRLSAEDARALADLSHQLFLRWKKTTEGDPTVPLQQAYVVHMALLKVLNPLDGDPGPEGAAARAALLSDPGLGQAIKQRGCAEGGFDSLTFLAWGLLLATERRDDEAHAALEEARRAGALHFLTHVVRSAPFQDDLPFHRDAFAHTLHSVVLARYIDLPVGRRLVGGMLQYPEPLPGFYEGAPPFPVPSINAAGFFVPPAAAAAAAPAAAPAGGAGLFGGGAGALVVHSDPSSGAAHEPSPAASREDSIATLLGALAEVSLVVPELHEQCEEYLPAFMDSVADYMRRGVLVPYLELLGAIATCPAGAQKVLERLQDPPPAPPGVPVVSWDALFRGAHRYCTMFQPREGEDPPAPEQVMVAEDRAALEAYLLVLRRVLEGLSEAEAASWVAGVQQRLGLGVMDLLFALLCHPVASTLRAALLSAVSAFVTSPYAAAHVWERLEASRILLGGPTPPGGAPPGVAVAGSAVFYDITYQLNEREAREQTYPETLAFVRLLNKLWASGAQPDEGRPYARYSRFVREAVLVSGQQRGYRSSKERWGLVHACLRHLCLLLAPFRPAEAVGAVGAGGVAGVTGVAGAAAPAPPPAQELLVDLLAGGPTFQAVLGVLEALSTDRLEQDKRLGTEAAAEEEAAVLCAMRVLLLALGRDRPLLEALRRDDVRGGVHQPLEAVLRRDPARMVSLLEFVRYQYNPALRAAAVRLATELNDRVPQLVQLILEAGARARIVEGYAACLEEGLQAPPEGAGSGDGDGADDEALYPGGFGEGLGLGGGDATMHGGGGGLDGDGGGVDDGGTGGGGGGIGADCVGLVMRLLLSSVERPAPSMVHLLLGFDVEGGVDRAALDPLRSYSCLQVILNMLDSEAMAESLPQRYEQCLQLAYELCADPLTEGPAVELLRQHPYDFFWNRLLQLGPSPLPAREPTPGGLDARGPARTASLCQRAWLLHLQGLALHIGDASVPAHRDAIAAILKGLLVDPVPAAGHGGFQASRPLALEMLSVVCFPLREPELGGSHEAQRLMAEMGLHGMLSSPGIVTRSERDEALIDVRALGQQLLAAYLRLDAAYATTAGGATRAALREAVHEGVRYAHALNQHREEMGAQRHMLRALQELVEVALSRRYDIVEAVGRGHGGGAGPAPLLYNLLEGVLEALGSLLAGDAQSGQAGALAPPLCDVVHTVMARLKEQTRGPGVSCAVALSGGGGEWGGRPSAGGGFGAAGGGEAMAMMAPLPAEELLGRSRLSPGQCHELLARLLSCVLSGERHEGVRRPLYGALLSYLHYCRALRSADMPPHVLQALLRGDLEDGAGGGVVGPGGRVYLDAMHAAQRTLEEGSVERLQRSAPQLVGALVRDALEGAELTRALALRVLESLVGCEPMGGPLTEEVHRRDLPRSCLAAMAAGPYEALLLPSVGAARALHTVEAQLSLLLRLCRHNAKRLADLGALPYLTACRALSLQPEEPAMMGHGGGAGPGGMMGGGGLHGGGAPDGPTFRERHHQVVAPLLRLAVCLVSSLPASGEVAQQAADFVETHHRMLLRVLADRGPEAREDDLEELDLAAALLSRLCASGVMPAPAPQLQARVFHMCWQLLGLDGASRSKYVALLEAAAGAEAAGSAPDERARAQRVRRRVLSIRCSLVRYIRALGARGEVTLHCFRTAGGSSAGHAHAQPVGVPGGEGHAPTLSLLSDTLQQACMGLERSAEERLNVLNHLREVDEKSAGELQEIILEHGTHPYAGLQAEALGQMGRRRVARAELARAGAARERDVSQQLLVVENVLSILFTQLRAGAALAPSSSGDMDDGGMANGGAAAGVDPAVGTPKEVEALGKSLLPALERLAQLQERAVERDVQFTHTLVRRLKDVLLG